MKNIYLKTELEAIALSDWLSPHELTLIPFVNDSITVAEFLNLTPLPLARKLYVLSIASELTLLEVIDLTVGVVEKILPIFEEYHFNNTLREIFNNYKANAYSASEKASFVSKSEAAQKLSNQYSRLTSLFNSSEAHTAEVSQLGDRNYAFQVKAFDRDLVAAVDEAALSGISEYEGDIDSSDFIAFQHALSAQAVVLLLFKPVFYRPKTDLTEKVVVSQALTAAGNLAEKVSSTYQQQIIDFAVDFVG